MSFLIHLITEVLSFFLTSEQKCIRSQKYAAENGLPILKNVLLPKQKGFCACLEDLRGSLDAGLFYFCSLLLNDISLHMFCNCDTFYTLELNQLILVCKEIILSATGFN